MNSDAVRARAEAVLAAWNRRDYEAVAENVSPNVVLVPRPATFALLRDAPTKIPQLVGV